MPEVRTKRVYDDASDSDGFRVLVDRLWPRGVSKEAAALAHWAKDIAPSNDLRAWHRSHLEDETEFIDRYRAELDANPALPDFRSLIGTEPVVTLLYASRDGVANNATVLRDILTERA
jgi:DNA-3-methyladenine glycosylase